jgi:outer membrane protein
MSRNLSAFTITRFVSVSIALFLASTASTFATAQIQDEGRFFIRGGPAYANFDASADVSVAGVAVAGGDVSVHTNTGAIAEVGYALSPHWQATFAFGIPPKARFFGAGTLGAAGKLGDATYGPAVLAILYTPLTSGNLRPYIGGGVNYTIIFNSRDATLTNLKVDNAFGTVLQFGIEYKLSRQVSWFFDIKKIWLKTNASGVLVTPVGSLPASARVTLDPLILNTGLSFHF